MSASEMRLLMESLKKAGKSMVKESRLSKARILQAYQSSGNDIDVASEETGIDRDIVVNVLTSIFDKAKQNAVDFFGAADLAHVKSITPKIVKGRDFMFGFTLENREGVSCSAFSNGKVGGDGHALFNISSTCEVDFEATDVSPPQIVEILGEHVGAHLAGDGDFARDGILDGDVE